MQRFVVIALAACVLAAPLASAQSGSTSETAPQEAAVGLADVVLALERVEALLATRAEEEPKVVRPYQPRGFGGGWRPSFIYLFEMGELSTYTASRGSYGAFSALLMPFVDGNGGTWRWTFSPSFQLGFDLWGGGLSSRGFRKAGEREVVDKDADGYDDYYSYATYGIGGTDFLAQWTTPIVQDAFYLGLGARAGLLSESFRIEENRRTVLESTLSALGGAGAWNRTSLDAGAYATLQFQPSVKARWFKLSLSAGFDYPMLVGAWSPAAGVHKDEVAPPADFRAMRAWAGLGLAFIF